MFLFRNPGDNVHPDAAPNCNWQGEYYDDDHYRGMPLASAWVLVLPDGYHPWLNFVLVVDDERGKGLATKLVLACLHRWPNMKLSDGISEAGKALYRKIAAMHAEADSGPGLDEIREEIRRGRKGE
jgi:hypothetical protein